MATGEQMHMNPGPHATHMNQKHDSSPGSHIQINAEHHILSADTEVRRVPTTSMSQSEEMKMRQDPSQETNKAAADADATGAGIASEKSALDMFKNIVGGNNVVVSTTTPSPDGSEPKSDSGSGLVPVHKLQGEKFGLDYYTDKNCTHLWNPQKEVRLEWAIVGSCACNSKVCTNFECVNNTVLQKTVFYRNQKCGVEGGSASATEDNSTALIAAWTGFQNGGCHLMEAGVWGKLNKTIPSICRLSSAGRLPVWGIVVLSVVSAVMFI